MDASACRELSITFDVEGNWRVPAAIDFTETELDALAAVTGALAARRNEP